MSTDLKCQIKSTSSAATEKIAALIGSELRGGEVLELISDLGGGKTVFAKGLVRGAASNDEATSPTFTISKIYHAPIFDIHHFDFYRLKDPGIVAMELAESLNDPKVVNVIEWADIVKGVLPKNRLRVIIETENENHRVIKLNYPKELSYLVGDLVC